MLKVINQSEKKKSKGNQKAVHLAQEPGARNLRSPGKRTRPEEKGRTRSKATQEETKVRPKPGTGVKKPDKRWDNANCISSKMEGTSFRGLEVGEALGQSKG